RDVVEQMPSFPGGKEAMMSYVSRSIKYPTVAEENGTQGLVIVSFVVEKDGSISGAKVIRSVDPSLDKEALRIIRSMPRWTPGKQDGKPVRVKYTVPVSFRLH
ncbi:MAG: TonB family protein, partial [Prevotella sp.]|nr:TonB family protein [Prevotella sp.]